MDFNKVIHYANIMKNSVVDFLDPVEYYEALAVQIAMLIKRGYADESILEHVGEHIRELGKVIE